MSPYRGSHRTLRPPSQQPLSIGSTGGERAELRLERPHEVGAAALREALEQPQRLGERRARPLVLPGGQRRLAELGERPGEAPVLDLPAALARGLLERRARALGIAGVEREGARIQVMA